MRGEDAASVSLVLITLETPPHAWGRLVKNDEHATALGNTPTCVGKTAEEETEAFLFGKHPHMRGEDETL